MELTNLVTLTGRLSKDPTLSMVKDGTLPLLKFGFYVPNKHSDKDNFYFVKRFGEQAEIGAKMLKKGDKVTIIGELTSQTSNGEDGFKYYVEIIACYIGYDVDKSFEQRFTNKESNIEKQCEPKEIDGSTIEPTTKPQEQYKKTGTDTGRMNIPGNIDSLLEGL